MREDDYHIILDDDSTSIMLESAILRLTLGNTIRLHSFGLPRKCIDFLANDIERGKQTRKFLFLDINMPDMSGWEVLASIQEMSDSVKSNLTVYMLSSSIDARDKERAARHPLVTGFIEKPLTIEKVQAIFEEKN